MDQGISELVSIFKEIIYRELFYASGGSIVLVFFFNLSISKLNELRGLPLILFSVGSYVIGFCLTDLFTHLHLVTLSIIEPSKIELWLTWNLSGIDHDPRPIREFFAVFKAAPNAELWRVYDASSLNERAAISRITDLAQLGATFFSCFFVAFIIYYLRLFGEKVKILNLPPRSAIFGFLFILISLKLVNMVKITQRSMFLLNFYTMAIRNQKTPLDSNQTLFIQKLDSLK